MVDTQELKNCPFCDSKCEVQIFNEKTTLQHTEYTCSKIACRIPRATSVKEWNTRAEPKLVPQELTSKELDAQKGGDLEDKLPKLYIDWGSPNEDETAISFFDKDGTAHTATGIIARLIAEQWEQLTQTQQALDSAVEALEFYADEDNTSHHCDSRYEYWEDGGEDRCQKAKAALASIRSSDEKSL